MGWAQRRREFADAKQVWGGKEVTRRSMCSSFRDERASAHPFSVHLVYDLILVGDLGAPELVLQLRFHLELAQFVARHELRTCRHTVSTQ